MASEIIGACKCPVCGSTKASLRLSAKQLSYVHCNTCHCQCFSRSDVSDTKMRGLLILGEAKPEPELEQPPIAAAPAPAPAAKPKASWGMQW